MHNSSNPIFMKHVYMYILIKGLKSGQTDFNITIMFLKHILKLAHN